MQTAPCNACKQIKLIKLNLKHTLNSIVEVQYFQIRIHNYDNEVA